MVSPKFTFWFGVWTSILLVIAGGTVALTNVFPADWIPYIKGWSQFLGTINNIVLTALAGYSSTAPGPLTK